MTIPGGCLGFLNHQQYDALPFFAPKHGVNVPKSMTIKFIVKSQVKSKIGLMHLGIVSPIFTQKNSGMTHQANCKHARHLQLVRQFSPVSESLIWFVGPL